MSAPNRPKALALLGISVLLCAAGHLLLKESANGAAGLGELARRPGVFIGLAVYGSGTLLWIQCLRRLDLAFAYPASAIQIVIVYLGAAAWLGEEIPLGRLIGVAIIIAGIFVLFTERRQHDA